MTDFQAAQGSKRLRQFIHAPLELSRTRAAPDRTIDERSQHYMA